MELIRVLAGPGGSLKRNQQTQQKNCLLSIGRITKIRISAHRIVGASKFYGQLYKKGPLLRLWAEYR